MGYQTLGTIGASTTHTTGVPSQKNVQQGKTRLELLAISQGTTRLNLLASPKVQNLRGTTPINPLASRHGTTPLKPSARAWVLTSYYIRAYIPTRQRGTLGDLPEAVNTLTTNILQTYID